MKTKLVLSTILTGLLLAPASRAANTGSAFYGDPPDATHPWAVHDHNRPQPPRVEPLPYDAAKAKAPAGAIVLFDGTEASMSNWEADKTGHVPTKWVVRDGAMECTPGSGYIRTKEAFGDCQLHVEWAAPAKVQGESQGRGNSGIFPIGHFEVQVLDNYNNPTYADGFACSVYSVNPPMANALRPPGEFQAVDITYHRQIYTDGKCTQEGWVTVYCNGILVQDRTQLEGGTGHMGRSKPGPWPEKGPLKLQDHGNPVRFRNIWYRPMPTEAAPGGTTAFFTPEAAAAKRKEIAATIRADAAQVTGPVPQLLRFAESLSYDKDDATLAKVQDMASAYTTSVKALPADKMAAKKDEVKRVRDAFKYLARWKTIPDTFAAKVEIDTLIKDQGWDKKK